MEFIRDIFNLKTVKDISAEKIRHLDNSILHNRPVPKLAPLPQGGHKKILEKMCKTFARHCTFHLGISTLDLYHTISQNQLKKLSSQLIQYNAWMNDLPTVRVFLMIWFNSNSLRYTIPTNHYIHTRDSYPLDYSHLNQNQNLAWFMRTC